MIPGAEITPHLTRHGINATLLDLPLNKDVGQTIADHARLTKADMIVMGAYHHSQLRERFFGGVTHFMLEHCPAPLFMAH
jgi:nucleotide-binding universal stress UspA family protein